MYTLDTKRIKEQKMRALRESTTIICEIIQDLAHRYAASDTIDIFANFECIEVNMDDEDLDNDDVIVFHHVDGSSYTFGDIDGIHLNDDDNKFLKNMRDHKNEYSNETILDIIKIYNKSFITDLTYQDSIVIYPKHVLVRINAISGNDTTVLDINTADEKYGFFKS